MLWVRKNQQGLRICTKAQLMDFSGLSTLTQIQQDEGLEGPEYLKRTIMRGRLQFEDEQEQQEGRTPCYFPQATTHIFISM